MKTSSLFKFMIVFPIIVIGLVTLFPTTSAHAASSPLGGIPQSNYCDPGWEYVIYSQQANTHIPVTPPYADYNGTPSNASAQLSASTTGTVSLSTTAGVTVDANAIFASLKASFSVTISLSVSTTIGNNININIPPYTTGYGQYGVWALTTTGHYYYRTSSCNITYDQGTITVYAPENPGWKTWLG
ncbi:hypothetical protein [Tengunoibacter tsumagoiensis]|uniref:Uncharacterized protein n=1 Tax=Tengunoibacter tsumagoiensis TaxID=2014871 RepID=A0A402A3G3_9CHLR|nr:hypothetical protein [Tengunoibacter tsumagoiensis]GCE13690.1 hypothetical protein KTT_35490 [Tengunoibacter tsumagoiensis]